ncbi:hypothetical protein OAG71_02455 [bacterium]|nr:hypothetical protein [bacterium]
MAKSRSQTALIKAIEKSDSPVYLIDDRQCLAYGNEAFFAWIGGGAKAGGDAEGVEGEKSVENVASDWIGTRLVYSNSVDLQPLERRLCGLTPPPELINAGQPFSAMVSCNATDPNALPKLDLASFSFIDGPAGQRHLLAVVVLDDASKQDATVLAEAQAKASESVKLHTALRTLAASLEALNRSTALIGDSPYVARLQKQTKAASQHGHEFTILGPAGSGRELLARLIMAQRNSAPQTTHDETQLVTLHGYVADRELVQSCVAQAITLATEQALEASHRTDKIQPWMLVLDADQLDAASQAELWATLQSPSSRLRILATAERDLIKCVQTSGFHSGLAHLLTTQTIETISLQQHLGDLSLLIQYEIENCNVGREVQLSGLSASAMQMLKQYHWPGDLAELAALIKAASDHCGGSEIDVDDLPEKFRHAIAAVKSPPQEVFDIDLEAYLEQIELKLVARALQMAKNNKTKASKLLGISRAKLLRRIQHFDLQHAPPVAPDPQSADLSADDFRPLDEPLFEEADD